MMFVSGNMINFLPREHLQQHLGNNMKRYDLHRRDVFVIREFANR